MQKQCQVCNDTFLIEEEDFEFYRRIAPVFNGRTYEIPSPSVCPECRFQRRAVWRNEFNYYRRECPLCRHSSISVHSPQNSYPCYCNRCWWSDSWDPRLFGLDLHLEESFFQQFSRLQARCPKPFLANDNHTASENIEYCQGLAYSKNCYLATTSWRLEDCLYCSNCGESKNLVDCRFVGDGSELVYESATCRRTYSSSHLYGCNGCRDCHLGIDLQGCSDCIACVGLRNQKFCIFNKQYSEADYRSALAKFDLGSYANLQQLLGEFAQFAKSRPQRGVLQINCERSYGHNIFNCKNFSGFNVWGGEDSKYYVIGTRPKNCYDILVGGEHQWCYEGVNPDHSYMSHFSVWCWSCSNVLYSDNCHSCKHVFGCIGLRRAEYCILNRQYSKNDYEQLVPKLIETMQSRGEWGEFFPISVSPFAYNETIAQDYFPLSAEVAAQRAIHWIPKTKKKQHIPQMEIPDHISEVSDDIVREVLCCSSCNENYKIVPLELRFYRLQNIPIPRTCANCRRKARFERTGLFKTYTVSCGSCAAPTQSATTQSEHSLIFCQKCYSELY